MKKQFILLKLWVDQVLVCSTIPMGNTQVSNGRFTIPLDASCVPAIHQNKNVDVEVVLDGTSMGKTSIAAVPYAVEADTASNFAPGSAIASLVPPGTISAYAGVVGGAVTPPPGWLLCDGSAVNRTQYAGLFAAIGTGWGSGDGATTFNLPDLRGRFARGVDMGTGRDPTVGGRTASQPGGNVGDNVGTLEVGAFASHNHGVTDPGHHHTQWEVYNGANVPAGGFNYAGAPDAMPHGVTSNSLTGITVNAAGGAETRPLNVAVNYLIKL